MSTRVWLVENNFLWLITTLYLLTVVKHSEEEHGHQEQRRLFGSQEVSVATRTKRNLLSVRFSKFLSVQFHWCNSLLSNDRWMKPEGVETNPVTIKVYIETTAIQKRKRWLFFLMWQKYKPLHVYSAQSVESCSEAHWGLTAQRDVEMLLQAFHA